jgi:hypothetical protein
MKLSNRFAACRAHARATLREVSEATGIAISSLCRIEAGHDPSWSNGLLLTAWCDKVTATKRVPCSHQFACMKCGEGLPTPTEGTKR